MQKTILITGSTDGIGLETAKMLVAQGHGVLLHGRNPAKLADAEKALSQLPGGGRVESFAADLSKLSEVESFAAAVAGKQAGLDVLINNAGILRTSRAETPDGLDVRFAVNAIAPYLLTKRLLPLIGPSGRIVNVSSAAQSPVDLQALAVRAGQSDMEAYAQSKLALTMWSRHLAQAQDDGGPVIVAVNPGSMLGSKMVRQGFGVAGGDIRIGAEILVRAALDDSFATASGAYFDNDAGQFGQPHPDALDDRKSREVVDRIEAVLAGVGQA
ncbi:SDR family NAD(P)-dependent oxidoreductase [Nitratireductor sp. XY-223]|uniref:SDR family NAD(P)-dependent oxidoreductase n=1 Tax=Nitratireductor sp. XY-223 TaxID=2561926 RepID=UPI0010A9ECCD|nr:SDR family NAD(P)-dependent oxidoreductase [Nitratireductor sp. XY-223]